MTPDELSHMVVFHAIPEDLECPLNWANIQVIHCLGCPRSQLIASETYAQLESIAEAAVARLP